MNVVILAGGLGTRFKELSVYPKILLPTPSGKTILQEQLEYFKEDNVILIINEKYYNMVCTYCNVNDIDINIVPSTNTNGSGNTLAEVYSQSYNNVPENNVLFFWSDILFENKPEFYKPNKSDSCVIYTIDSNCYRYLYKDGNIVNHDYEYNGNVPGIFWISDVNKMIPNKPVDKTMDLIDFLKEGIDSSWITNIKEYKIENNNIIEYRSLEDYKEIMHDKEMDFSLPYDIFSYKDGQILVSNKGQYEKYMGMNYLGLGERFVPVQKMHDKNYVDMSYCDKLKTIPSNYSIDDIDNTDLNDLLNELSSINKNVDLSESISLHTYYYNNQPYDSIYGLSSMIVDFDQHIHHLISKAYNYVIDHSNMKQLVLSHGQISQSTLMYYIENINHKHYMLMPSDIYEEMFLPASYDRGCALMISTGVWNGNCEISEENKKLLISNKINAITGLLISLTRLTILKNDLINLNKMYNFIIELLKEVLNK